MPSLTTHIRSRLSERLGQFAEGIDLRLQEIHAELAEVALPARQESAAVALSSPKTAALCYDRVWSGLGHVIPPEIAFDGNTDSELEFVACAETINYLKELADGDDPSARNHATAALQELFERWRDSFGPNGFDVESRILAYDISATHDVSVTSVYSSRATLEREYRPGDYGAIVATLSALDIPIETSLSWDQVSDFRKDKISRTKLRRFVHWLDRDMAGRSAAFISDEVSGRLEDYRAALHKHGIAVALGSLSSVIDSKALVGGAAAIASLSYAADTRWALSGGAAIVLANCAVHIAHALLDIRGVHESAAEIAFIAALQDASDHNI